MSGLFMLAPAGYVRREALTAWDLRKHGRRTDGGRTADGRLASQQPFRPLDQGVVSAI